MAEKTESERIALERLKKDHELARVGLRGTLTGAVGSLLLIAAIAGAQMATGQYLVRGWSFVGLVAVIVIPITFYGAFIFDRVLRVGGEVAKDRAKFWGATERMRRL
jgi:hypothetical protein